MDLGFFAIIDQMAAYPSLAVILILVLIVTIVSGATDAPNAIATAVNKVLGVIGGALSKGVELVSAASGKI